MKKNPLLVELQSAPMLVASLDGDDLPFLLEEARTQRADIVEIRMDVWSEFLREGMQEKLARFKEKIGIPMLVSFRGGHPFPSWWQPLHWRAIAHADLIDVEWNPKYPWKDIRKQTTQLGVGLIVSHHDYEATPSESKLGSMARAAWSKGADMVKLATKVKSPADIRTLVAVSDRFTPKRLMTVMGMGPWGPLSRLVSLVWESKLLYGYIGAPTAVGQSPYKDLQERVRQWHPLYAAGFIERQKKRGSAL
jgi:3-dehydroquinate dehydratase-1